MRRRLALLLERLAELVVLVSIVRGAYEAGERAALARVGFLTGLDVDPGRSHVPDVAQP